VNTVTFDQISDAVGQGWENMLWYKGDWMKKEVSFSTEEDLPKWKKAALEGVENGIDFMYLWPWTAGDEASNSE
jgi:hypothetical protein